MTSAQHTVLARLSDGEWRIMRAHSSQVLAALYRAEMIRCDFDRRIPYSERLWTITPDGLAALERAA